MRFPIATMFALAALAAAAPASTPPAGPPSPPATTLSVTPVALPGGAAGIGLDDLTFAPDLGRVLAPGGRSGLLDLIDPRDAAVTTIAGFTTKETFTSGHGDGATSADEGRHLLFVIDRSSMSLAVVDPALRSIVARAPLGGGPDYVRWVAPTGEVWVTEPDKEQIEIFTLPAAGAPAPSRAAVIAVPGGPESLVIDATRGRAYTHLWKGSTVAIDLRGRSIVETWKNGCAGSRGIALDAQRGLLFAGCAEGRAVSIGLDAHGAILGTLDHGAGVDIIAYNAALGHLYLPGARSASLAILGVSATGALSLLGEVRTAAGAHCVAADDRGQAWVCDPDHGRLLLVRDTLPAVAR